MRAEPRDEPRPEWAKFDVERWRGSPRYRSVSPTDRILSTALFVWQTQKGPILNEPGELSVAAQGFPVKRVRDMLSKRSDFQLVDGAWVHPVAMAYYNDAVRQIDARRRGGITRQQQAHGAQESSKESCKDSSPLPSPPVEKSVRKQKKPSSLRTVGQQTALTLPSPVDGYLKLYMAARAMRMNPAAEDAMDYGLPGGGTLDDCRTKMGDLLAKGHPWQLLVSLPALTDLPGLVVKPDVLLRSGEHGRTGQDGKTYGATCHAVVIDGMLGSKDLVLDAAQVKILRAIGTLEWAKARGVYLKDAKLWEDA